MSGVLKAKVGGVWVPIMGSGMTAEVARWNKAWGQLGQATNSVAFTTVAPHTTGQSTGIPLTVTETAGRRLKITTQSSLYPSGGLQAIAGTLYRNGAPFETFFVAGEAMSTVASFPVTHVCYFNPTANGAATYALYINGVNVNTAVSDYAAPGNARTLAVEDIGPAIYNPAPPPVNTPTPWTAVTFQNGWINTNGGYQTAQYRLVGDKVELRGRIQAGTLGVAIFNLPVGYRPPASTSFSTGSVVAGNWAFGTVEVQPGGDLLAFPPGTNSGYILNGITFSTTA